MQHGKPSHTSLPHDTPLASVWTVPCVALLLACSVLTWVSYDEYQESINEEYRFLDAHARIAQNQIAGLVRNVRLVLTRIAEELPQAAPRERTAYGQRLAAYNRQAPEIATLAVLGETGRVEAAANPGLVGFDGSRREYFAAHRAGPHWSDFHISRPYKSVYGDYSIGFSLPILDGARHLIGVAVAGVHYTYFKGAMTDIRPPSLRGTAAIVNDEGDYLYFEPDPDGGVGDSVANNRAYRAYLATGKKAGFQRAASPRDGLDRLYVMRPVADTSLSVVVSTPVDDVLAHWREHLLLRATLFVLGAALVLRLAWTAHRRQREVLASKDFSERLIGTANAMMLCIDAGGCLVAVNEATERITGYSRQELLGRSLFETLMPRDRYPAAWQVFLRCRETGELPRAVEAPVLARDGEERLIAWQNSGVFEHDGRPAVISFGIDITERTQFQEIRNREEVSRGLVAVQEEERRRIAFELHDRTSPNLTVLDINLKLLAAALPAGLPPNLADLIEDSSATLSDTIANIRAMSVDFRPPLLDYAGLWPALSAYARQFRRRTGIAVQMAGQRALRLAPEVETNLFHIAQEALANCAAHSHAGTVSIRQTMHGNRLVLLISDNGAGFDPNKRHDGQGLATMRQRAEFVGARLTIDSHPGKGTCIAVVFGPCVASAATAGAGAQRSASQAAAPLPAMEPLAKQAVSR
ncbi:MAG: PAS domain S-box protein [Ignavibacteria bacterium]